MRTMRKRKNVRGEKQPGRKEKEKESEEDLKMMGGRGNDLAGRQAG